MNNEKCFLDSKEVEKRKKSFSVASDGKNRKIKKQGFGEEVDV